jgi:hypothetical protein
LPTFSTKAPRPNGVITINQNDTGVVDTREAQSLFDESNSRLTLEQERRLSIWPLRKALHALQGYRALPSFARSPSSNHCPWRRYADPIKVDHVSHFRPPTLDRIRYRGLSGSRSADENK